jgi:uncharacterized protein YdbL (DUF1318 family)
MCALGVIVSVVCVAMIIIARRIGRVGEQFEGR